MPRRAAFALLALSVAASSGFAAEDPRALLARADAASALPAGKRCVIDASVADTSGTVGWRVAVTGPEVVVVSTSLAEGRRQAVLQRGSERWFQTEAMGAPLKVGAAQRMNGTIDLGELLDPRLAETWAPDPAGTGAAGSGSKGGMTTIPVVAAPDGGSSFARAELDLSAEGRLAAARWYAASGKLAREATWRWDGGTLRGVEVTDATRGGAKTTVTLSAPRCGPTGAAVEPVGLLAAARALAAEPS